MPLLRAIYAVSHQLMFPYSAMLPCCHAAMLPCCHAAMLPCCHAAITNRTNYIRPHITLAQLKQCAKAYDGLISNYRKTET
jgi:hypothetical protein